MEIEIAFGEVLKQERKNKNITQEELAFYCDLDRTYISLLERGKRNPTIGAVFKIARVLELKPSSLIFKIENKINFNL
ncbi:helix-turn-helix domain-containing protein [Staphylococcus equorum]|uniref:helix-turn-helix domain-containing protein n=1 Tax=Staphylococcus equorum TaxID=246432 RepID=UPI003EB87C94